jgi:hypothetical protein
VLSRDRPIVIVAEPGREQEAAVRLGRIGFDNVAGYLESGMHALEDAPDRLRVTTRGTAAVLAEERAAPSVRRASGRRSISTAASTCRSRRYPLVSPSCRATAGSGCIVPAATAPRLR